jgi:hypothetical protein
MSLLGKIFVVIVTILSLVFLGVQSTLYYHSTDWREAFERLRERHQKVVEKKNEEIAALQGAQKDLENVRQNLEANVAQLKDLNKSTEDKVTAKAEEFNKARSDLEQLGSSHKTLVGAMEGKEKELTDERTRNDQLSAELQKSLGEKETAEAQVARLIGQKAALEKDLSEVRKDYSDTKQRLLDMQLVMEELERQGVPVGTLVLNHKPVPPINGKVAGIKADVSPALVLLTVGKDEKVEKGFQFTVYRGAEFVGKVVVEKVNADSAGCRVLFTAPGKVIKAGDDVATRLD